MSQADGTIYNARQVSEALGVSTAMVRKYAAAYEAITGAPIKQHARDGRLYTRDQLDALINAKGFVESNAGMSVDTALRIALGRAETAVKEPQAQTTDINTSAFAEAILAELRGLRLANERLLERLEALGTRQLPSPEPTKTGALPPGATPERIDRALEVEMLTKTEDGVMVKAARWLERRLSTPLAKDCDICDSGALACPEHHQWRIAS
jgi:hypothetical protein